MYYHKRCLDNSELLFTIKLTNTTVFVENAFSKINSKFFFLVQLNFCTFFSPNYKASLFNLTNNNCVTALQ